MRRFILLSGLALAAFTSQGTMVRPTSLQNLTDQADIIFSGIVLSNYSHWAEAAQGKVIVTETSFEVVEALKGNPGPQLTLQSLGGAVGQDRMEVEGVPGFDTGEKVLLFVRNQPGQTCPIVSFYHGKLRIQKDAAGNDIAVRHNGQPVCDISEIGSENAPGQAGKAVGGRKPSPLHEIHSAIRARVAEAKSR
jgi:hypothetical protein